METFEHPPFVYGPQPFTQPFPSSLDPSASYPLPKTRHGFTRRSCPTIFDDFSDIRGSETLPPHFITPCRSLGSFHHSQSFSIIPHCPSSSPIVLRRPTLSFVVPHCPSSSLIVPHCPSSSLVVPHRPSLSPIIPRETVGAVFDSEDQPDYSDDDDRQIPYPVDDETDSE
jgi:hypothetical protein